MLMYIQGIVSCPTLAWIRYAFCMPHVASTQIWIIWLWYSNKHNPQRFGKLYAHFLHILHVYQSSARRPVLRCLHGLTQVSRSSSLVSTMGREKTKAW